MKVLILGGTRFLGRHIAESLINSNHDISLFNRGKSNRELFTEVEHIQGDRYIDLNLIEGRSWDAIIDTGGYDPRNMKEVVRATQYATKHFVFISTCSVYPIHGQGVQTSEEDELLSGNLDFENFEPKGRDYGIAKVYCEDEVQKGNYQRVTVLRPGLIVGPHDESARFPYWVKRFQRGGKVLCPGSVMTPCQFVDARDIAEWIVKVVEKKIEGTFDLVGPQIKLDSLFQLLQQHFQVDSKLIWADEGILEKFSVQCWSDLPLWVNKDLEGFVSRNSEKAVKQGFSTRAINKTIEDTARWLQKVDFDKLKGSPLSKEREETILSEILTIKDSF